MSTIVNSINIPTVEPSGGGQTTISSINIPTVEPSSLTASVNSINFPLPILKINSLRLNDDYVTDAILVTNSDYEHVDVGTVSITAAKIVDTNPVTDLRFADVDITFNVAGSFTATHWGDSNAFGTDTPLEFGIDPTALELHYTISYNIAGTSRTQNETLITKIAF